MATDEDSSPNGDIAYSLYYSQSESRKPFVINSETGELKPSPFVRFDREQRALEEVTVKVIYFAFFFQRKFSTQITIGLADVN